MLNFAPEFKTQRFQIKNVTKKKMKKLIMFFAAFCAVQFVRAGNTIVIRPDSPHGKGKTEVTIDGDSIVVIPKNDAIDIEVCVRDVEGNIISQYFVCANINGTYEYNPRNFNNLYFIEIRDEQEVVYENVLF